MSHAAEGFEESGFAEPALTLRQRRRDAFMHDLLLFCTAFTLGALGYAVAALLFVESETFWSVSLSDGLVLTGIVAGEIFLLWNVGLRQGIRGHSIGKHRTGLRVVDRTTGEPTGALRGLWRGLIVVALIDLALAVIPIGLPTALRRLTPEEWHVGAFAYVAAVVLLVQLFVVSPRGLPDVLAGTTLVESSDVTTPRRRTALWLIDGVGVIGVLAFLAVYLYFLWPLMKGHLPSLW